MNCFNKFKRKVGRRLLRKIILVVSEGSKTEPNYFLSFDGNGETYRLVFEKPRYGTDRLVQHAIDVVKANKKNGLNYDQVWCVFDKDDFSKQQFNRAIKLAESRGIKCAYSNESFELWFLLHFKFNQAAWTRDDYEKELKKILKRHGGYEKNRSDMYELLKSNQVQAIKYAKKLDRIHKDKLPADKNPYTGVYKLVEALNKLNR